MKCLTVCQPYASLICSPQSELPPGQVQKRVENRTWYSSYRGPILIHAGKSLKYLRDGDRELFPNMPFGAIVGRCQMIDCVQIDMFGKKGEADKRFGARDIQKYPWLITHIHAEGPYGFILDNIERFETPIPYKGFQGLFEIPDSVVETGACKLNSSCLYPDGTGFFSDAKIVSGTLKIEGGR